MLKNRMPLYLFLGIAWCFSTDVEGAPKFVKYRMEREKTVPGHLVVGIKDSADANAANNVVDRVNRKFRVRGTKKLYKELPSSGSSANVPSRKRHVLIAVDRRQMATATAELRRDADVDYVEPNYIVTLEGVPADPQFSQLWGLHNTGQTGGTVDADIDAVEAWDRILGSESVIVGIVDTGIDYTHPDLLPNLWKNPGEIPGDNIDNDQNGYVDDVYGINAAANNGNPLDDYGHGTHVAGTIGAASNQQGVIGVSPKVRILACKFLTSSGSGTIADAVECFNYINNLKYVKNQNIVITNNSWGGSGYSQALADAMKGPILHVCAAGNSNLNIDTSPMYPAAYALDNIVAVAATDHKDIYAYFTNYGPKGVDLAAPGVNIYSTVPMGSCSLCSSTGYRSAMGTSMASPHVAGAAALLFAKEQSLGFQEAKNILLASGNSITGIVGNSTKPTLTGRRLNADRALEALEDSEPPEAITNLSATPHLLSVTLEWTATGDDGTSGTALEYDVRYSTNPITESNWESALLVFGEPDPQPSGSAEKFTVQGLASGTTYYFAIRVSDGLNWSPLSNVVQAGTDEGMIVFEDNMENGSNGWTVTGFPSSLWHLSSRRSQTPTHAWYYGSETTGNYDVPTSTRNYGELTRKIDLTTFSEAALIFSEWSQLESSPSYDRTRVQVSNDKVSWTTVFESHGTAKVWEQRAISLKPYIGGEVYLRFSFDTIDGTYNSYEGWYIDSVKVVAPLVKISVGNVTALEGNSGISNFSFPLKLANALSKPITFSYSTVAESADSSDFVPTQGEVTFPAGETSTTVVVDIKGDESYELDERFFLVVKNPYGVGVAQAEGKIVNDDSPPSASLLPANVAVVEGNSGESPLNLTVQLSKASGIQVAVSYVGEDVSAKRGADYVLTDGNIVFAPGETTKILTIPILGDTSGESDEIFRVKLTGSLPVEGAGTEIKIVNDDPLPILSVVGGSVVEGNTTGGKVPFMITSSFANSERVTFDYNVTGVTATEGTDFQALSGTSTFDPLQVTKTLFIPVIPDTKDEFDETISLTLSNPVNATVGGSSNGTILDDDAPPVVTVNNVSVLEGNSGTQDALFTVKLSIASEKTVTVSYKTTEIRGRGKASERNDFEPQAGTLTFLPGTVTLPVNVPILGDTHKERDETYRLELYGATNASIGNYGTGTIRNND